MVQNHHFLSENINFTPIHRAESKCGRYFIRDRIYSGRLFIGSKNKLVQRRCVVATTLKVRYLILYKIKPDTKY